MTERLNFLRYIVHIAKAINNLFKTPGARESGPIPEDSVIVIRFLMIGLAKSYVHS